jgi:hypothetical protein
MWCFALPKTFNFFSPDSFSAAEFWVALGIVLMLPSCENEPTPNAHSTEYIVDYTEPRSVVGAIFAVANGANPKLLEGLCDPSGECDLDVRRICDYANGFDKNGEFPMFFAAGKVIGQQAIVEQRAFVPILFGPNGDLRDTMELVQKNEKWYLERF